MPQVPIVMPKMSMTMTEGELLVWHVKVGDEINAGDVVCEVATDKIDMEVEATASGTVVSLHGNPGDVLEVGTPLLMVEAETDDLLAGIFDAPAAPEPAATPEPVAAPEPMAVVEPVATLSTPAGPLLATPKAREAARNLQVNLADVPGTGTDGVIKSTDVISHGASRHSAERTIEKRLKTRLAIARAIAGSLDIPGYSVTFELPAPADVPAAAEARIAKWAIAWAKALTAHPELHADWNGGDIQSFPAVKIAFSVMAAHGVVTPSLTVPTNVDAGFEAELRQVLGQAAAGKVALEHLGASTTGLVDLGDAPVSASTGILIRPQSTALAVGRVRLNAAGERVLPATITADHRISDPADVLLLATAFAAAL